MAPRTANVLPVRVVLAVLAARVREDRNLLEIYTDEREHALLPFVLRQVTCRLRKSAYLCNPKRHKPHGTPGSIAQLVQSTCLTSRGSLVRIQLFPRKQKAKNNRPDGTKSSVRFVIVPERRKLVSVSAGAMTNQETKSPPGRLLLAPTAFKCPRGERHLDVDGRRPAKSSSPMSITAQDQPYAAEPPSHSGRH